MEENCMLKIVFKKLNTSYRYFVNITVDFKNIIRKHLLENIFYLF